MIRKLVNTFRSVISPPAPRVPNPRDSDIYLVSYPKSGNTWMRYLLAYAIWPELPEVNLKGLAAYMPSYGLKHDADMLLDPSSPCNQLPHRIIKEHAVYDNKTRRYIKRAIYIARDGRDALVSYWHFCNQRDGMDISFSDFIELSAAPTHSYGPWKNHVAGWLAAPLEAKLILRYEDLLNDTASCVERALRFSGITATPQVIDQAVLRASFESMREMEERKGLGLEQLKSIQFVREGKTGNWRNTFTKDDIERFNRFHGYPFPDLGYV